MSKKFAAFIILGLLVIGGGLGFAISKGMQQANEENLSSKPSEREHHDSETSDLGELFDLTNQSEVSIDIKDFVYSMPNIKIKKGTKVTWTNRETTQHNAMAEHSGEEHAHDAPSKDEVRSDLLAGPLLSKDESYSFTFSKAGIIGYHCAPHPFMKGSVTVVE